MTRRSLARALGPQPDYIALGPIYPTFLKKMPFAPQGLERIGVWKRKIGDIPLVAIGGITLERSAGVLDGGGRQRGGRDRHHAQPQPREARPRLGEGDAGFRALSGLPPPQAPSRFRRST